MRHSRQPAPAQSGTNARLEFWREALQAGPWQGVCTALVGSFVLVGCLHARRVPHAPDSPKEFYFA